MKISVGQSSILAGFLALSFPLQGSAQEFFRNLGTSRSSGGMGPVNPSEYTYENGSPSGLRSLRPGQELTDLETSQEDQKYNFAVGPLRFSMAAGVGLAFNDNITLSDHHREADFIFLPTVDLDARWRLSELNTLRLSVQASYAKYFDHSELDTNGVLLSPNSELALTFFLGGVKFTVRDRFSYQEDTFDIPQLSNVAQYKRYENQAGISMDWQINQQFDLPLGYDHYNLWASGDTIFSDQDRSIDTIYARPSMQITAPLKVGLNAAYSFINFNNSDRASGYNLMVGPFVEFQLSDYTNLYLEVGYQSLSTDGASDFTSSAISALNLTAAQARTLQGSVTDNSDANSYYVKLEVQNKPSQVFRHRLSASKTAEIGFATNYYDLYHIEYEAEWKVTDRMEVGPTLFYEYYETSGSDKEKAHRVGAAFGVRQHFSDSITLGLDYRFIVKDSNLPEANYYQNLALLSIYYKF